jgi:hypothetical protein
LIQVNQTPIGDLCGNSVSEHQLLTKVNRLLSLLSKTETSAPNVAASNLPWRTPVTACVVGELWQNLTAIPVAEPHASLPV